MLSKAGKQLTDIARGHLGKQGSLQQVGHPIVIVLGHRRRIFTAFTPGHHQIEEIPLNAKQLHRRFGHGRYLRRRTAAQGQAPRFTFGVYRGNDKLGINQIDIPFDQVKGFFQFLAAFENHGAFRKFAHAGLLGHLVQVFRVQGVKRRKNAQDVVINRIGHGSGLLLLCYFSHGRGACRHGCVGW